MDSFSSWNKHSHINCDENFLPNTSFKGIEHKTGSKKKTMKEGLSSYAGTCDTAQNSDWAAELMFTSFPVVEASIAEFN